ncbi:MAG: hypothetical protein A2138_01170 [Deltaproteobacteria bacterium RBG_16_71_12]|nr:MAG: hypothetical protein A2138_01170 [Deltaproteobacteria bacterium RBG_16_71_12]
MLTPMPSVALDHWFGRQAHELDEIAAAHASVGGTGPGRRHATSQINAAYTTLLSSQFQAFCRDLHTEAAVALAAGVPQALQATIRLVMTTGRKLDSGNPNGGNIGADFGRLGVDFWPEVESHGRFRAAQRAALERCMLWRNALAHQDFNKPELGGRRAVLLNEVRSWRAPLDQLALIFDEVIRAHLHAALGSSPW